jgi:hypothetical protein
MYNKDTILSNYNEVKENIEKACKNVNRENDVTIVAVTKTFSEELIQKCIDLNILDVGENRPQEMRDKYEIHGDQVNWHMIGHLQRNKVKYIIDKVSLIHSLDSVRLAKELNKRAKKNDLVVNCLVQINVVNEDAKFGILKKEVETFLEEVKDLEHIKIVGLMNMAPFYDDSENARSDFRQMKILFNKLKKHKNKHYEMKYLSMGMTNDYVVAVEEGSNMVRIGSAIFGQRDYS